MELTERSVEGGDLAAVPLFQRLAPGTLATLAEAFVELAVDANEMIFEEGDPAEYFFVLGAGELAVFRDAVGMPVQLLTRLGPHDFFGELGLFGTGHYRASVRATEPCLLWRAEREPFLAFVERQPVVMLELQTSAALRQGHQLASALELGRRREVRIRCKQQVNLDLGDGERVRLDLENLSLGGICLAGAPKAWQEGMELSFGLEVREGLLPLHGRVRWRKGDTVGIGFEKRSPKHDLLLQMAIRLILESGC